MSKKSTESKEKKNQPKISDKIAEFKKFPVYIPILIFLVTTVIFFWGQLSGNSFFWEDFAEYVYPTQTFAARESAGGTIPFWNPYIFSGMPFIADLQTGFFYPLNRLLNFFVQSDGTLSVWGLQFVTIIHFFIAQIAFYFLIIHYKKSQFAAIISSIAYSFSGIMVFHVIHPMMIYHLAWFPLVLMFFDKGIKESNFRYGIIAGLLLGMSLLAGHPQTTLYLFFFLFVYFVWNLLAIWFKEKPTIKQTALMKLPAILTFLIAVGIFAIQYLPSRELADNAVRSESSYTKASEGSMEFVQVLSTFTPNIFGTINPSQENNFPFYLTLENNQPAPFYYYWETSFYFGIITILLAIFGLIVNFKNRTILIMFSLSIFGFLYALGSNFFVHGLFYNLPFFNLFRMPARMMMFAVFGFSVIAAFGFDEIFKSLNKHSKNIIFASALPLLIGLITLIGVTSGITGASGQVTGQITNIGLGAFFFSVIAFLLLYFANKGKLNYILAGVILTIITFIDLYIAGSDFNSGKTDIKQQYTINARMKDAFKTKSLDSLYRVNTRSYNPPYMATNRNQGMVDGFQNTEGYNPLVLARVNPPVKNQENIYDLLNVKYELRIDQQQGQPFFFENNNRMPRAWLVHKYHVTNPDGVKQKMESGNYDYLNEVVLEENPGVTQSDFTDTIFKEKVKIREYKNSYIRLEIMDTSKDAVLVMSEIWYPAWKVFVDGMPAKLLRANYSLRAVAVPKGASKIEFRFASESFVVGQWITIVTLIISIPALFIGYFKKKKDE